MRNIFNYFYGTPTNKPNTEIKDIKMDSQYETFIFEFTSNEHFPIYEKQIKGEEQEYIDIKLQSIENIYLDNYDQQLKQPEQINLIDYIIQENDTLFGLELKFNINQNRILKLNDISPECFVPGMRIKLPNPQNQDSQLDLTDSTVNNINQNSYFGRILMDEIMSKGQTKKFNVYYVTNYGCIEGVLTINNDIILFDPSFTDLNKEIVKKCQKQSILNFQACLMTKDVRQVELNQMPMRIAKSSNKSFKDYLILIHVNSNVTSKKLVEIIPILSFRIQNDQNQKEHIQLSIELYEILTQVVKTKSQKMLEDQQQSKEQNLTIIPFFDIQDSLFTDKLLKRINNIWGAQDYLPQMMQQSKIFDNDELNQIIAHIPSIYKTSNWTLIFSNIINGSSFQTLLHKCENRSPLILVIQDVNECKFGAYLNESLQLTFGKFFGNGETFLWTLKQNEFQAFRWTETNNYFIFCESDGFAIGCGDQFGLYINQSLTTGNTNKCETYKNDLLTVTNDFSIKTLELWSLSE
ncbi:unnamed protein product [Paramecium sonneborni]|uniref:Oxidation resistance protein 1 n=1 Tax=Paramecium sonneborni TaxID=65129 RepID=A0A8S1KCS8_9CILI|nr:unnamed protein product [Paramecium sonneborni]